MLSLNSADYLCLFLVNLLPRFVLVTKKGQFDVLFLRNIRNDHAQKRVAFGGSCYSPLIQLGFISLEFRRNELQHTDKYRNENCNIWIIFLLFFLPLKAFLRPSNQPRHYYEKIIALVRNNLLSNVFQLNQNE